MADVSSSELKVPSVGLPLILNEYNAVQGTNLPKDFGYDTYFGRVPGNGGPWLEFVITQDKISMNQWMLITKQENYPDQYITLPVRDKVDLTNLRIGTIFTISKIPTTIVSSIHTGTGFNTNAAMFKPEQGILWVNINIGDLKITDAMGQLLPGLVVGNLSFRVKVLNRCGQEVMPFTGEGVSPPFGIDAFEVFKLKANPSPDVSPRSPDYGDDGNSKVLSTVGSPNQWKDSQGRVKTQDFRILQFGAGSPYLKQIGMFDTSPFINSQIFSGDGEGLAFVPANNSFWIAEDNTNNLYQINKDTGALTAMIVRAELAQVPIFNGTEKAGNLRTNDIEAVAYDQITDTLYAVNGNDSSEPTVFRLTRPDTQHLFSVDSFQPLDIYELNFPGLGAAVSPDGSFYITNGIALFQYDYPSNTLSDPIFLNLPNPNEWIFGMGFSEDGASLWIVTSRHFLYKINWASPAKEILLSFDMEFFGVRDPRAVDTVDGKLYVIDGFDFYVDQSLKYAIHTYDIVNP